MMKKLFVIFGLFFSASSFAAGGFGHCEIYNDDSPNGQVQIVCFVGGVDDDPQVLTKDSCIKLRNDIKDILESCLATLTQSYSEIQGMFENGAWLSIPNIVEEIRDIAYNSLSSNDFITVATDLQTLMNAYNETYGNFEKAMSAVSGGRSAISSAMSALDSISCSDKTCSNNGNGTLTCPCQDEFAEVISAINASRQVLVGIHTNMVEISLHQAQIMRGVTNIAEVAEELRNRLNAPDDRMWTEVNEIYSNIVARIADIRRGDYLISDLLYNVRQYVQNSENGLKLTTEGLISLYNSVLLMGNQAIANRGLDDFGSAVVYFSNTVSTLFQNYSELTRSTALYLPTFSKYDQIYAAFTNDNLSARVRYARFASGGGITNWFQRMELYQQAQLGWFDDYAKSPMEQEQERLTESSLELQILNTTNNLGAIVSASGGVSNSLDAVMAPVSRSFEGVVIQASLPTLIRLLPEIELGAVGNFGPIDLDTTAISDYCDYARKITSLIWRIVIWSMYAFLAFGVGRVLFVLVLYVVNFLRDL